MSLIRVQPQTMLYLTVGSMHDVSGYWCEVRLLALDLASAYSGTHA